MPLVSQKPDRRGASDETCGSLRDVGVVSRAEGEGRRPDAIVCQGIDLGCWAITRAPDGLKLRPPFLPRAERWARMAVQSMLRSSGSLPARPRWWRCAPGGRLRRWHSDQWRDNGSTPPVERVVGRRVRDMAGRSIPPVAPDPHHLDNPADDAPVIHRPRPRAGTPAMAAQSPARPGQKARILSPLPTSRHSPAT